MLLHYIAQRNGVIINNIFQKNLNQTFNCYSYCSIVEKKCISVFGIFLDIGKHENEMREENYCQAV